MCCWSWRWAPLLAIGLRVAAAAADGETTLYSRIRPTHIAWGEIAVVAGGPIQLALPEQTQFGRALALTFTSFERRELQDSLADVDTATQ